MMWNVHNNILTVWIGMCAEPAGSILWKSWAVYWILTKVNELDVS